MAMIATLRVLRAPTASPAAGIPRLRSAGGPTLCVHTGSTSAGTLRSSRPRPGRDRPQQAARSRWLPVRRGHALSGLCRLQYVTPAGAPALVMASGGRSSRDCRRPRVIVDVARLIAIDPCYMLAPCRHRQIHLVYMLADGGAAIRYQGGARRRCRSSTCWMTVGV
jgi:hypothetical protein